MKKGSISKTDRDTTGNKTGTWRQKKPVIDLKKCNNCFMCNMFCADFAIKLTKNGKKIKGIDYDFCKGCCVCVEICPKKAIEEREES